MKNCRSFVGCSDRWCPLASWCVLGENHFGNHLYETPEQRQRRQERKQFEWEREGFKLGARVTDAANPRLRGKIVGPLYGEGTVPVQWENRQGRPDEFQNLWWKRLFIVRKENPRHDHE